MVEVHRRVGDRATVGGQQVDDHLVQRLVLADTISEPVVVEERVFVERRLVVPAIDTGANLQQLGPLHHPELGKFFTLQEHVNQLGALIGALIRQERLHFRGLGIKPDDIDVDAADIFLIGAEARRGNAQAVQALVDRGVDVIKGFGLRTGINKVLGNDDHLSRDAIDIETGQHEGRAAFGGNHYALLVDLCDRVVVRHEQR